MADSVCPVGDFLFQAPPAPYIPTQLSTAARFQALFALYLLISVYLRDAVGRAPPGWPRVLM